MIDVVSVAMRERARPGLGVRHQLCPEATRSIGAPRAQLVSDTLADVSSAGGVTVTHERHVGALLVSDTLTDVGWRAT